MKTPQEYEEMYFEDIYENISDAIEAAQIEAIKEAAESATTKTNNESTSIIVDKQSILKLIK